MAKTTYFLKALILFIWVNGGVYVEMGNIKGCISQWVYIVRFVFSSYRITSMIPEI